MRLRTTTRMLLCVAVAAATTAGVYSWDAARELASQTEPALRWARQMATQAEGLALEARERGHADGNSQDSVTWAARLLSQGTDSRIFTVSKFHTDSPLGEPEFFSLDSAHGVFEYTKVFLPEEGNGITLKLQVNRAGFLGARSQLASDASVVCVFLALLMILLYSTNGSKKREAELRQRILEWVGESKTILTDLGRHIREMIREASVLAGAARDSREAVGSLRDRIHAELTRLHESHREIKNTAKISARADALAKVLSADLRKKPGSTPAQIAMAEELRRLVSEMRAQQNACERVLRGIQTDIEPWAADADATLHAYDDVSRATNSMSGEIRKTTETMLNQARLMQDLKKKSG